MQVRSHFHFATLERAYITSPSWRQHVAETDRYLELSA